MTQGILFIATGRKYVQAGIRSAKTARKYCPNLAIHLFTDKENFDWLQSGQVPHPFSSLEIITDPYHRSKVDYMARTPFDQTLYLDTDTAINADISEMFRLLERFDIAMAHAMHRGPGRLKKLRLDLPGAFPEFNTGVVLYKKSPAVLQCLNQWEVFFKETGKELTNDQTTLRELLWSSDLRIATLPPEYNMRFLKFHFLWSKSEAVTRIFHLKQYHRGWFQWIYRKIKRWIRDLIK